MNAPLRLTPTMNSRKLLALEFVQQYWAKRNASPSLQEIANALGTSRSRALDIVRKLADDRQIEYRGGRRGIMLPSVNSEALRILLAAGYTIGVGEQQLHPPSGMWIGGSGTIPALPMIPELDHIPYPGGGDQHDDNGTRR